MRARSVTATVTQHSFGMMPDGDIVELSPSRSP